MVKDFHKKVLDKGYIRVVDIMGNDTSIVQAARVSYGKGTKKVSQDRSLIRYLLRHKHTSPFEMCVIKLHLKMPIFIARQWVRHRTASVNEYSARYSVMPDEYYIPEKIEFQSQDNKQGRSGELDAKESKKIIKQIKEHSHKSHKFYQNLLDANVARELARSVLPINVYTEFYWQMNLHNLLHFVRLRSHPTAQYEIRVYSDIIQEILKQWVPVVYEAFCDYEINATSVSAHEKKYLNRKEDMELEGFGKTEEKEFYDKWN